MPGGLLRQEILAIIARLARKYRVVIKGAAFSDYVSALRDINSAVTDSGKTLYEVLRAETNIYVELDSKADRSDNSWGDRLEAAPDGDDQAGRPRLCR